MARRLLLGAAVLSMACAAAPPPPVTVVVPPGAPARRPPGVAVDPRSPAPRPARAASAEEGVVVLAEPVDSGAALLTVNAFFDAMVAESPAQLERVLTRTAHLRSSAGARPEAALQSLRRRLDRLDYGALSTVVLYRPDSVRIFTAEDASSEAAPRSLPVLPRDRELLVLVQLTAAGASTLFGQELAFLLEPAPARGFKIRELFEEFRLP